jgi:ethanolamine utilization protein EutA
VPVVRLAAPLSDGFDPAAVAAALVVTARQHDVNLHKPVALAVSWTGTVSYPPLAALARTVATVAGHGDELLLLVLDADIGQALGALLVEEAGLGRPLVVLDGIELGSLDYLDVGQYLDPPGVVPVVIKSLLFA